MFSNKRSHNLQQPNENTSVFGRWKSKLKKVQQSISYPQQVTASPQPQTPPPASPTHPPNDNYYNELRIAQVALRTAEEMVAAAGRRADAAQELTEAAVRRADNAKELEENARRRAN
jgi:hypothetical protein